MASLNARDTKRILMMIDPSLNMPVLDCMLNSHNTSTRSTSKLQLLSDDEPGTRFVSSAGRLPWSISGHGVAESTKLSSHHLQFKLKQ